MKETGVKLLPLGSIVRIEEPEATQTFYLVIARAIAKNESDEVFSRYKVAPHPYGDVPSQEIFTINADQISEIVFEGYSNQQDQEFLDNLFVKMSTSEISVPDTHESEIIPEEEPIISEQQRLQEDPFYKFRS